MDRATAREVPRRDPQAPGPCGPNDAPWSAGGQTTQGFYDPDLWTDEYTFLNASGQAQIQSDLFYDYRTNVDAYPRWQAWLQKTQPKLLVLWGQHDLSFDLGEPERYRKDVPKAQVYVLDAGHFALDTKADEIAALVKAFTSKESP